MRKISTSAIALLLGLGLLLPLLCLGLPAIHPTSSPCCPGEHRTPVPAQNSCCKTPAVPLAVQTLSPVVALEHSAQLLIETHDNLNRQDISFHVESADFFSPPAAVLRI